MKKLKRVDVLKEYFNKEAAKLGLKLEFDYSLKNEKEIDGYLKGKYKFKKVLETIKD